MRFLVLVVGGVSVGALSVGGVRTIVPQSSQMFQAAQFQMAQAVHALGGDMSKLGEININPLKAYEDVRHQIASSNFGSPIDFGSAKPVSFSKIDVSKLGVGSNFNFDNSSMKRAMVSGWSSQIQQTNNRMQDISAYSRNPMGWHGAPPF
jgi:hypothetical protein